MKVAILALCGVLAIASAIVFRLIGWKKKNIPVMAFSLLCLLLFLILVVSVSSSLGAELFATKGNASLATKTFAVGGFLFTTIPLGILTGKTKWTAIPMTAFLILGIVFIIMSVYVSKYVFQPESFQLPSTPAVFPL